MGLLDFLFGGGDTIIEAPETQSYGEAMRESLQAQIDLGGKLRVAESADRPAYAQLEARILEDTLLGEPVVPKGVVRIESEADRYTQYVKTSNYHLAGYKKNPAGRTMAQYGKDYWDAYGEKETAQGRTLPPPPGEYMKPRKGGGWSKVPAEEVSDLPRKGGMAQLMGSTKEMADGRMPGFSVPTSEHPEGEFQGMTVMGEDLRKQAASATREADIADVEKNIVAYKAVMEKASPETADQLDNAVGALNDEFARTGKSISDPASLQEITKQLQAPGKLTKMVETAAQKDRGPLKQMTAGVRQATTGVGRGGPIGGGGQIPGEPPGARPAQQGGPLAQMGGQLGAARGQAGGPMRGPQGGPLAQMGRGGEWGTRLNPDGSRKEGTFGMDFKDSDGNGIDDRYEQAPGGDPRQAQMGGQAMMGAQQGGPMIPPPRGFRHEDPYAEVMRGRGGQLQAGYRGRADQMALGERGTAGQMGGYSALSDPFGLRQTLQQQAAEDLAAGRGLSPRQRREAEQAARRWGQASGRGLDPLAAVTEVEELMKMRGAEESRRRAFAGQVLGQEAALQTGELGRGMQQAGFNIQNEIARQEANLGRRLTEQEFNTLQETARQEANIGRQMGAGQFNIQQEVARQEANLGRRLSAQEFNTLQDAARREADLARSAEAERFNIGMGEQRTEADIAREMGMQEFNIQQEEARRTGDIGRELSAADTDVGRTMQQEQLNEQLRQQRLQGALGGAGQVAGLEQQVLGDPLQGILGRPAGTTGFGMGQQMYGGSQFGLDAGPQLYSPESGLSYMLGQQTNQANLAAAQAGASAKKSAGLFGAAGSIIGGMASGGTGFFCWIAREVYGESNPKWRMFREWMLNKAPIWFRDWYLIHGESVAEWLKDKPELKARIKTFMDSKLEA
jgi:hypothetical protein